MRKGAIRPLALCIVKYQDKILVGDGYDFKKNEVFYRLLGGGIEFGETGKEAVKREFKEELDIDLENVKYITTLENIFMYNGNPGHEIILVFSGDFVKKEFYRRKDLVILDTTEKHKTSWQKISDFKEKKLILYPTGIARYL